MVPGLIVMTVTDGTGCGLPDLDPQRDSMVVLINADKQAHDFKVAGATGFTLHAVQQASADPIVKTASFGAGVFHVPARTSAVFEQLQGAAQGAGLPCNTHGTAAKPPASSGGGCGAGPTDLASLLGLVGLAAALRSRRRRG